MRSSNPAGPARRSARRFRTSFTKATVTWRCSASPLETARCARSGAGRTRRGARRDVGRRRDRARCRLEPAHQMRAVALLDEPLAGNCRRRLGAENDLAGGREVLELEDPRRGRARDEQLAVRPFGEEEVAVAQWTPADMRSSTSPAGLGAADRLDRPLHVRGRPAARAACASPKKSRRSASPRNLSTSPPCRSATSIRPSKRPRSAGRALPRRPALRRQPLGECGEARDVHGDE